MTRLICLLVLLAIGVAGASGSAGQTTRTYVPIVASDGRATPAPAPTPMPPFGFILVAKRETVDPVAIGHN